MHMKEVSIYIHMTSNRPAYRQGMVWTKIPGRKGGCLYSFPVSGVEQCFL